MTRKDYEAIAAAIRATPDRYLTPLQTKQEIAGKIAAAMSDGNPRFDRNRFLHACGVAS